MSGPNLAREIAQEQPAATVVACTDPARAGLLQRASTTPYLRPYTNTDVVGCELGGAVKNVIALACGMAEGMGFGDNTRASLITRGLAETARLGVALGADPMTFAGLAGLGDLVATCSRRCPATGRSASGSAAARRWRRRSRRGRARSRRGSSRAGRILDLAGRIGVEMPITEQVVAGLPRGRAARGGVAELMGRETKPEVAR